MELASVHPSNYIAAFKEFLTSYYWSNIEHICLGEDEYRHYSLFICAQYLIDFKSTLASLLLAEPTIFLPYFDEALLEAQEFVIGEIKKSNNSNLKLKIKRFIHVRLQNLPPVEPTTKANISSLRSLDVNKMIQLSGTIIRIGMIKMLESSREYRCTNSRCHYHFVVKSDLEQGNIMELPKICPSSGGKCKSSRFQLIQDSTVCSDYQQVQIQEQVQKLMMGSIPRSISVVLEDDLADTVKAGDDVVLVGILMRRWISTQRGSRCELDMFIRANSISITNNTNFDVIITDEIRDEFSAFWSKYKDAPLVGRNLILKNICPQVYGLYIVKLAVALTLIGGCTNVDKNGLRTRGEPHMLLIGDAGTAKSQFLRFTAQLSPRSILTTGIGTTSAGLTCTAVKDGGDWVLEAGALVLADRGVCCIDEFSSIRAHDRSSIHEAMEQQTLSVAKAGLVCKLNTRTTIFAVTNPKGKYDIHADVSINTTIASPLLSRFDIVLVLLDTPSEKWDETVSSFILSHATRKPEQNCGDQNTQNNSFNDWNFRKLQAYLYWVKGNYNPCLTEEAEVILQKYYQIQRQRCADTRSVARTTIRMLESMTRIAQAHARLMCRSQVIVQDAIIAVLLMEASMNTTALIGIESVFHSEFAENPEEEYEAQEDAILKELNLSHLSSTSLNQIPPTGASQSYHEQHSQYQNKFLSQKPTKELSSEKQSSSEHVPIASQNNSQYHSLKETSILSQKTTKEFIPRLNTNKTPPQKNRISKYERLFGSQIFP